MMKEHDEISSRDEKADDKAHLEVAIKKAACFEFRALEVFLPINVGIVK